MSLSPFSGVKAHEALQGGLQKLASISSHNLWQSRCGCADWVAVCCSDEIYANSIFKRDQEPKFISMLNLAEEHAAELGPLLHEIVHIVFGLSKDWCVLSVLLIPEILTLLVLI